MRRLRAAPPQDFLRCWVALDGELNGQLRFSDVLRLAGRLVALGYESWAVDAAEEAAMRAALLPPPRGDADNGENDGGDDSDDDGDAERATVVTLRALCLYAEVCVRLLRAEREAKRTQNETHPRNET